MTDKKKPPKEEEDDSTMKLLNIYRKKCDANGVTQIKPFREKVENAIEEGKMELLQLWEEIGPVNVRAIMDSFSQIAYKHLKKLRLWKVRTEDEGLRAICNYISKAQTLEYLDLLDNDISPLGCQFLGTTLASNPSLVTLKLDHNIFGTAGLKNLALGLSKNNVLDKLSIKYCKIDQQGARYIQEILANINGKLRSLKLQGNPLKNEGVFQIMRAVDVNETLQKINLADTQINLLGTGEEEDKLTLLLESIVEGNTTLFSYDLRFNQMSDEVAHKIVMKVQANTSVVKMELSDSINQQIKEILNGLLKKRKPKKKGKGKGKKKGSAKKKK